jgi:hypothetical protein
VRTAESCQVRLEIVHGDIEIHKLVENSSQDHCESNGLSMMAVLLRLDCC